jgi:hypothetical protein
MRIVIMHAIFCFLLKILKQCFLLPLLHLILLSHARPRSCLLLGEYLLVNEWGITPIDDGDSDNFLDLSVIIKCLLICRSLHLLVDIIR